MDILIGVQSFQQELITDALHTTKATFTGLLGATLFDRINKQKESCKRYTEVEVSRAIQHISSSYSVYLHR